MMASSFAFFWRFGKLGKRTNWLQGREGVGSCGALPCSRLLPPFFEAGNLSSSPFLPRSRASSGSDSPNFCCDPPPPPLPQIIGKMSSAVGGVRRRQRDPPRESVHVDGDDEAQYRVSPRSLARSSFSLCESEWTYGRRTSYASEPSASLRPSVGSVFSRS